MECGVLLSIWTTPSWLTVTSGTECELAQCHVWWRWTRELAAIPACCCEQVLGNSTGPTSPNFLSSPLPCYCTGTNIQGRGGKALTHHCGFLSSEHRAVPESHSATELLLPAGDCCPKHSPRYYTVTAIVTGRCCLAPPHHTAGLLPCCQSAEPFGACLLAGI